MKISNQIALVQIGQLKELRNQGSLKSILGLTNVLCLWHYSKIGLMSQSLRGCENTDPYKHHSLSKFYDEYAVNHMLYRLKVLELSPKDCKWTLYIGKGLGVLDPSDINSVLKYYLHIFKKNGIAEAEIFHSWGSVMIDFNVLNGEVRAISYVL